MFGHQAILSAELNAAIVRPAYGFSRERWGNVTIARRAVLGVVASLPISRLVAAPATPVARPLVVLMIDNPWLMVIGSDSPTFALYENGEVIYREGNQYKSVDLSKSEKDEILNGLDLVNLPTSSKQFMATHSTDQPTQTLFLFTGAKPVAFSIYGSRREAQASKDIPPNLLNVYEKLLSYRSSRATNWMPEKVEVMIWPYEYAPDKSIIWPKEWPGLDDPSTIKRKENFSIFLASSQYQQLRSFLATRPEKGAVEIGGKKWAADVRFPFPGEKIWMVRKAIDAE
jgi:hypothetical protein